MIMSKEGAVQSPPARPFKGGSKHRRRRDRRKAMTPGGSRSPAPLGHVAKAKSRPRRLPKKEASPDDLSGSDKPKTPQRMSRVGTACERCRARKTKCDTQMPCRRCLDDGLVCTGGSNFRPHGAHGTMIQVPILEHTRSILVAILNKLYSTAQREGTWSFGNIKLNDTGDPIIHDLAEKVLGISSLHSEFGSTSHSAQEDASPSGQDPRPSQAFKLEQSPGKGVDIDTEATNQGPWNGQVTPCQSSPLKPSTLPSRQDQQQAAAAANNAPLPVLGFISDSLLQRRRRQQRAQRELRQLEMLHCRSVVYPRQGAEPGAGPNGVRPYVFDAVSASMGTSGSATVLPPVPDRSAFPEPAAMKGFGDPMLGSE